MSPRLLRSGQCLLIAAMLCASGGHWMVLQTVAWGGMIVDYSRDAGLTVAVEKTFDGQHPCELCKTIAQGKKSERRAPIESVKMKLTFILSASVATVRDNGVPWEHALRRESGELLFEQPAVPPPRRA